jgi:hypothetical protein
MAAAKGTRPPNAGKGRPKGVPNKTTAALKDLILQALANKGGVAYLELQADENPNAFLALVGRVLPVQLKEGGDHPKVPLFTLPVGVMPSVNPSPDQE